MESTEIQRMACILADLYQIPQADRDYIERLGYGDAPDNLAALEQWILHQLPVVRRDLLAQCIPGLCARLEEVLNDGPAANVIELPI